MKTRHSGFVLATLVLAATLSGTPTQQAPKHQGGAGRLAASIMLGPDSFAGPGRVVALAALSAFFLVRHRKNHHESDEF